MSAEYLTHDALPARHGFFTRRGGVSEGPYASLNASLSGGDDIGHVTQNRALVAGALGVPADRLVGVKQVHGTRVVTVTHAWPQGEGPEADALVTAVPGLAIGVITADCAPVLLYDARAGVLEAALAAMAALGATAAGTTAIIGPCIGQDSYEVGPDLRDAVLPTLPDAERCFRPGRGDRFWFDLAEYCAARLTAAGIQACHALAVDTLTHGDRFFSHRRRTLGAGGPIGHQISAIRL